MNAKATQETSRRDGEITTDWWDVDIDDVGFEVSYSSDSIRLGTDTLDFLDWLGDLPPGFEYKFSRTASEYCRNRP
jgi:hypothetical protein